MTTTPRTHDAPVEAEWQRALANAVRDPDELIALLDLPAACRAAAHRAAALFPLRVPHAFLERMERGNPKDPLLLQVLPLGLECRPEPGYSTDPLQEAAYRPVPGVLHKYHGRALLIATGSCAVHCRYCFRRHYPYGEEPRRLSDWEPGLTYLESDPSIREVILSGGDPLTLADRRLGVLVRKLDTISRIDRIRIHTRLPIVLPARVTEALIELLTSLRAAPILVVHANHPHEIAGECAAVLRRLVRAGLTVLNQAVLLRGINDDANALEELCLRLVNLGVLPYYLHQLDRVSGAAHFEVPRETGERLLDELRRRLPGYAVPRFVREEAGASSKLPLG